MFRAFNVTTDLSALSESYLERGRKLKEANTAKVRRRLQAYLDNTRVLDASAMQAEWFPRVHADVFISHSHQDEEQAMKLAGWLWHHLGLESFIDSCVWGYAGNLLRQIDTDLCRTPDGRYFSYEMRNDSTSHVHMMLVTALTKMIDSTECILFLNTPSSIDSASAVAQTSSPWIFAEIAMMQLVRRRTKKSHRAQIEQARRVAKHEVRARVQARYTADLTSLTPIGAALLEMWPMFWKQVLPRQHPLDVLYAIVPDPAENSDVLRD